MRQKNLDKGKTQIAEGKNLSKFKSIKKQLVTFLIILLAVVCVIFLFILSKLSGRESLKIFDHFVYNITEESIQALDYYVGQYSQPLLQLSHDTRIHEIAKDKTTKQLCKQQRN